MEFLRTKINKFLTAALFSLTLVIIGNIKHGIGFFSFANVDEFFFIFYFILFLILFFNLEKVLDRFLLKKRTIKKDQGKSNRNYESLVPIVLVLLSLFFLAYVFSIFDSFFVVDFLP